MNNNNSLSHITWNCKYHIVFAPKFRRKAIYGKFKEDIRDIITMLYFVRYLKGKSTLMIFERHANLISMEADIFGVEDTM